MHQSCFFDRIRRPRLRATLEPPNCLQGINPARPSDQHPIPSHPAPTKTRPPTPPTSPTTKPPPGALQQLSPAPNLPQTPTCNPPRPPTPRRRPFARRTKNPQPRSGNRTTAQCFSLARSLARLLVRRSGADREARGVWAPLDLSATDDCADGPNGAVLRASGASSMCACYGALRARERD